MITLEDLHWDDIKGNICGHCGACIPHCEWEKCQMNSKKIEDNRLGTCDICYLFCPRSSLSGINKGFVKNIDNINKDFDGLLNVRGYPVKTSFSAKSVSIKNDGNGSNPTSVQDGGFVTTLLKFLLKEKRIDAALIVKRSEDWDTIPFIATTEKDIDSASGSKYTISSTLSLLKDAIDKYEKIAFVGVPCQIRALRNMQLSIQSSNKNLNLDKVKFAIGLFCRENFSYAGLREFVRNEGIDITKVKKFDISAGKFRVYVNSNDNDSSDNSNDNRIIEKPIKELEEYVWPICHACLDFTSEFADISVGSVGSKKGYNTVLIRSEEGYKLFRDLMERNLIAIEDINTERFSWVDKLTNDKRKNIERLTSEVKNILYS